MGGGEGKFCLLGRRGWWRRLMIYWHSFAGQNSIQVVME